MDSWRWALPEGVPGIFGDGSNLLPVVREYVDGIAVFQGAPPVEHVPETLRQNRQGRRCGWNDGWVYFVQAGGRDGPIKIGYSISPGQRVTELQTGSPERLKLLATMRGDAGEERKLHRRFAKARISGEWFRPVPGLLAVIAQVKG